ncbi:MAG: peptidoglycan DD-metalloendopeptidase family protein [Eubacterium sp.]|nr:peptidoglycan DD-metalloendopeptidase family protein [Eubacterium sp.]
MKRISIFKKPISVLLAFCFVFAFSEFSVSPAMAEFTPEEEKAIIEQKIKEANNKLEELNAESAGAKERLDALNEKIDYLEQEMKLVDTDVEKSKTDVASLQQECEENEKAILTAEKDIERLSEELDTATAQFDENYEAYCQRLRAMYISGDTSILAFLLTSSDISQLLTRLEMLRSVSKKDSELLDNIKSDMETITSSKQELSELETQLTAKRTALLQNKEKLEKSIITLEEKQDSLSEKKTNISAEMVGANSLIQKLSEETGYYTEYLEDNQESLAEIDRKLAAAANKYADTVVTTTTTTTTTTTAANHNEPAPSTTTTTTTEPPKTNYIHLTYPVPSQKTITCGFYGYPNHNGSDFACSMNSNVVAAESGTVIISDDLFNEDGSYRSYGRYIVILHDKPTKSGDSVYTLYAHNSVRLVSEGQRVEKGQLIAYSGSTGNSSGPHCHFEVRTPTASSADRKNPADYLP